MGGGGWGEGTVYRLLRNIETPVVAISGTSPTEGAPGTSVFINGTGFTGASKVTFPTGAATPIDFTVNSDSQINIIVPANGVTGVIGVTAPRGTTYSPTFFYVQPSVAATSPVQPARGEFSLGHRAVVPAEAGNP